MDATALNDTNFQHLSDVFSHAPKLQSDLYDITEGISSSDTATLSYQWYHFALDIGRLIGSFTHCSINDSKISCGYWPVLWWDAKITNTSDVTSITVMRLTRFLQFFPSFSGNTLFLNNWRNITAWNLNGKKKTDLRTSCRQLKQFALKKHIFLQILHNVFYYS